MSGGGGRDRDGVATGGRHAAPLPPRSRPAVDYVPTVGDKSRDQHGMLAIFVTFALLYGWGYRLDRPGGRFKGLARNLGAVEETLLRTTESLVEHGRTSISGGLGQPGRDGAFYGRFAVGAPLVHVPLYAAGRLLSGGRREVAWQAARATDILIAALVPALVYRLARVLGGGPLAATAAGLITGAGTIIWPYGLWATPHLTSAACVTTATVGAVSYRRYPRFQSMLMAAAGLTAAILVRPVNALLAPVVLVHVFADPPQRLWPQVRRMPMFVLPVAGAVAWTVWHNIVRFGHGLDFGCGHERFTFPLAQSVPGLLIGRTTGLLWFNPPVILGLVVVAWLVIRRQREGVLLAASAVAIYLTAASWQDWSGGDVWGPVLVLEAIPLLSAPVALALTRCRRWWAAWSVAGVLGVAGLVVQAAVVLARNDAGRLVCWWRARLWAGPVLLLPVVAAAVMALRVARRHEREIRHP